MSSLEKTPLGKYRVRFNHRGKQLSRTFPTKKNALDWQKVLDAMGADYALTIVNAPVTSTLTLGEHLENHIERLTGVTEGTQSDYRAYIRRYMADISTLPLTLLTREAVSAWVNRLSKEGLSGKTIANVHGLLSSALNTAVSDKIVTENPCRGMRLPRTDHTDREMIFLTQDEFGQLFEKIPEHYRPFISMLVGTGMRFGEATALQVGDLDLENGSARIRQAWKKTTSGKARELGAPKSKKSNRTVAVPKSICEILKPLVENKSHSDFVFTTPGNRAIKQQFFGKIWQSAVSDFAGDKVEITHDSHGHKIPKIIKRGKGKHPRVHDLRHTFVSWAINRGVSLPVIQRQLGHESITTTINTYGHLHRADFDSLAMAIDTLMPIRQPAIEA